MLIMKIYFVVGFLLMFCLIIYICKLFHNFSKNCCFFQSDEDKYIENSPEMC